MVSLDFKHVHALHTLSQLPILVISKKRELVQSYGSDRYLVPYYQVIDHLNLSLKDDFDSYQGLLEETFLVFPICKHFLSIGPFYTRHLETSYQEELADRFLANHPGKRKECLMTYMKSVPCFSAEDIRSLIITVDAFFQTSFEKTSKQAVAKLIRESKEILTDPETIANLELGGTASSQFPNTLNHLNHIISLVKLGNTDLLRKEIDKLPLSGVSSSSISTLRAEKNLSIVYLAKLLELSFAESTDATRNHELAKHFMRLTEETTDLIEVLRVRAAAIISFSESLANKSTSDKKQIFDSILHYVSSHLYSKLKVSDIASHLYISESHLRSIFKRYSDISLQSYILKSKVQEAKVLLKRGMPVGEVAKMLHFYDTTHFYKTFKKYTGMTSNEYITNYRKNHK
ncbi:YSIRK-targeted surface antigen transcriptional regulator [Streptococcus phocae subsp. salmonis]